MTQMPDQTTHHRRAHLLVVVFVLLASAYMLTYSGRIASTDTLFLLDATGSLARYGDMRLDISAGVRPPPPDQLQTGPGYTPLPGVEAEPLQIILAAPLFWLADHVPGLGLAHTVYLFNILVVAGAGSVIFLYTLTLGYDNRVGVVAALLFGLGTIVWPYSKTFFQEPLTLLLILVTALLLEKWRQANYRVSGWLLLAVVAAIAAVLSKRAAVLALPALIIIAMPALTGRLSRRQIIMLALVIVALAGLLLLVSEPLGITDRLDRVARFIRRPNAFFRIVHRYLLSVGGSVWGTSPIILLALPGTWLLHRQRHYRYPLALVTMALVFAAVYTIWQGSSWFGGLSWPPRFLIPVVPFGVLAALPVIDRVTRRPLARLLLPVTIGLALYSFWIQLSGLTLEWAAYAEALPAESGGLIEWHGGLNLVRYLRWVIIPALWANTPLDFAWARLNLPAWPLAFGLLMAACGILLWRLLRHNGQYGTRWQIVILPITLALLMGTGLHTIYDDPIYQSPNESLHAILPIMAAEAQPGDVALLSDLTYERFLTNYSKIDSPRIVSLPFHPGEQPSPTQPPAVISENPDALVHKSTGPLIFALAQTRDRLWLLASSGPFIPWSVRPVERFMAMHYYPIRETQTDPRVRLIEYSLVAAPNPFTLQGPAYSADLVYDDTIRLLGYTLPAGTTYAPGDALPLSLYWRADESLEQNYKVAWFVRDANGAPVAQGWDLEPGGGFAPTSSWRVGVPVWDNRALRLPADTSPGDYRIWLVVYTVDPDGNIINLPVMGSETADEHIGILPTTIRVEG